MGLLIDSLSSNLGLIHDYANEKKTAKRIRRIALGSVGLIIVGGSMAKDDEGDWPESNYQGTY